VVGSFGGAGLGAGAAGGDLLDEEARKAVGVPED